MLKTKNLFFVVSVSVMFAACVLTFFYQGSALRYLTEKAARTSTEAANDDVAELVSNILNDETIALLEAYSQTADAINWEDFSQTNDFTAFDSRARSLALNTRILKIKIYARDGSTVYSTDLRQLGDDYSEREEVIHALRGRSTSSVSQRDFFRSFNEQLEDATIVSSYHSLRNLDGKLVGVIEIYADRTEEFKNLEREMLTRKGLFLLILVVIFFGGVAPLAISTYARTE